jgi:hypothetical protein
MSFMAMQSSFSLLSAWRNEACLGLAQQRQQEAKIQHLIDASTASQHLLQTALFFEADESVGGCPSTRKLGFAPSCRTPQHNSLLVDVAWTKTTCGEEVDFNSGDCLG